jgi:glutamate dehydrogenase
MELTRHGHTVHQIVHPVMEVVRDPEGGLLGLAVPTGNKDGADGAGAPVRESFMHLEIDEQSAPEVLDTIRGQIMRVLVDVRAAVAALIEDLFGQQQALTGMAFSEADGGDPVAT